LTNHSIDKFKNRRHDLKKERGETDELFTVAPNSHYKYISILGKIWPLAADANFRSADRWRVGFPLYNLREMGELTRNFQRSIMSEQGPPMNSYKGHSGAACSMGPAKK